MKAFNPFDHVDKSKGSLDESVLLSVKKCWKKDTATRSKGLLELTDWVSTCPEPEELEIFRDEYEMTVHHERLLRDQVADLSLGLAMVDRTFYKPLVKPMAARLLGGPYDPVNNISSKWSDFLQRLIPSTARERALPLLSEPILEDFCNLEALVADKTKKAESLVVSTEDSNFSNNLLIGFHIGSVLALFEVWDYGVFPRDITMSLTYLESIFSKSLVFTKELILDLFLHLPANSYDMNNIILAGLRETDSSLVEKTFKLLNQAIDKINSASICSALKSFLSANVSILNDEIVEQLRLVILHDQFKTVDKAVFLKTLLDGSAKQGGFVEPNAILNLLKLSLFIVTRVADSETAFASIAKKVLNRQRPFEQFEYFQFHNLVSNELDPSFEEISLNLYKEKLALASEDTYRLLLAAPSPLISTGAETFSSFISALTIEQIFKLLSIPRFAHQSKSLLFAANDRIGFDFFNDELLNVTKIFDTMKIKQEDQFVNVRSILRSKYVNFDQSERQVLLEKYLTKSQLYNLLLSDATESDFMELLKNQKPSTVLELFTAFFNSKTNSILVERLFSDYLLNIDIDGTENQLLESFLEMSMQHSAENSVNFTLRSFHFLYSAEAEKNRLQNFLATNWSDQLQHELISYIGTAPNQLWLLDFLPKIHEQSVFHALETWSFASNFVVNLEFLSTILLWIIKMDSRHELLRGSCLVGKLIRTLFQQKHDIYYNQINDSSIAAVENAENALGKWKYLLLSYSGNLSNAFYDLLNNLKCDCESLSEASLYVTVSYLRSIDDLHSADGIYFLYENFSGNSVNCIENKPLSFETPISAVVTRINFLNHPDSIWNVVESITSGEELKFYLQVLASPHLVDCKHVRSDIADIIYRKSEEFGIVDRLNFIRFFSLLSTCSLLKVEFFESRNKLVEIIDNALTESIGNISESVESKEIVLHVIQILNTFSDETIFQSARDKVQLQFVKLSEILSDDSQLDRLLVSSLCTLERMVLTTSGGSPDYLNFWSKCSSIDILLTLRFAALLEIDKILVAVKTSPFTNTTPVLIPWQDLESTLISISQKSDICDLEFFKLLIMADTLLNFLEGSKEDYSVFSLYIEKFGETIERVLLHICQQLGWFEQIPAIDLSKYEIFHFDVEDCQSPQRKLLYAAHILGRVAKITPSSLRSWKNTLPKGQRSMVEKRFEDYYSPTLISRELSRIRRSDDLKKTSNNLQAKILQTSTNCSIVAKYSMEEFAISLTITIPPAFPLDPVTVAGGERLGISEAKWRTWLLASQTLFNSENISIIDGLFLWKNNIDKSFAGMESCPICYCIFHPSDRSLPGPSCKTCKNKYHATCLYKWFKSGGNATCPMCRSVF